MSGFSQMLTLSKPARAYSLNSVTLWGLPPIAAPFTPASVSSTPASAPPSARAAAPAFAPPHGGHSLQPARMSIERTKIEVNGFRMGA